MNTQNLVEKPYIEFPDHTQLPESDGTFVKNFQEHPQGILLTDSITLSYKTFIPMDNIVLDKIQEFIGE